MILWWIKQFMASPPLCAIVILTSGIGFVVIGPYALSAGVFATDIGGRHSVALTAGGCNTFPPVLANVLL
eukprot:m.499523 g.499523  ORF g.499523 m.499523 type:complete len:70 (+) comp21825_c0_seq40:2146-2355(+)